MAEDRNMYTIKEDGGIGTVKVADEVVAIIAGLAASDVKGVASLSGNATREVIGKLGIKGLGKSIRLTVEDGEVHVWLKVNIRYGFNIPETSEKIQDRVATAIETMTGLNVAEVNVRVNRDCRLNYGDHHDQKRIERAHIQRAVYRAVLCGE